MRRPASESRAVLQAPAGLAAQGRRGARHPSHTREQAAASRPGSTPRPAGRRPAGFRPRGSGHASIRHARAPELERPRPRWKRRGAVGVYQGKAVRRAAAPAAGRPAPRYPPEVVQGRAGPGPIESLPPSSTGPGPGLGTDPFPNEGAGRLGRGPLTGALGRGGGASSLLLRPASAQRCGCAGDRAAPALGVAPLRHGSRRPARARPARSARRYRLGRICFESVPAWSSSRNSGNLWRGT